MTAYAIARDIEYIYEECPFADGSQSIFYKESLNLLETARPGVKLTFYLNFLEAKKSGNLFVDRNAGQALLHSCPKCGQPTSAPDLCSFCRMIGKASTARTPDLQL
jgi:tRNA(Ile)-lysidine synthase TilS/MesJ